MVAIVRPTFKIERALAAEGYRAIAGVDEAGSGCWAGPVFASAVILPTDSRIALIRDSKLLSAAQRERAAALIKERATAWAVGSASAEEIDALNIRNAGALAMRRALEALAVAADHVLVDAFRIPGITVPQQGIIRGDRLVKCIAAASVLAKVARDAYMTEVAHVAHPVYGFAEHKGYGTVAHRAALHVHGPCALHRRSYAPVREVLAAVSVSTR